MVQGPARRYRAPQLGCAPVAQWSITARGCSRSRGTPARQSLRWGDRAPLMPRRRGCASTSGNAGRPCPCTPTLSVPLAGRAHPQNGSIGAFECLPRPRTHTHPLPLSQQVNLLSELWIVDLLQRVPGVHDSRGVLGDQVIVKSVVSRRDDDYVAVL